MKFIVCSNTMEVPHFYDFIAAAVVQEPDAAFLVCGDLLNVFPEPGEDLEASIFFDLYGELIVEEMERLRATRFGDLANSRFIKPLRDMFAVGGASYEAARLKAAARYEALFDQLARALSGRPFFVIPGNMDYPDMLRAHCDEHPNMFYLDGDTVTIEGICVGGVGGIPRSAQPFFPHVDISPYERSDDDYARALSAVHSADVVLAHLSPSESPQVESFVREGTVKSFVCRAPFELTRRTGSCRGTSRMDFVDDTLLIQARPFEPAGNHAFVVQMGAEAVPDVTVFTWQPTTPAYPAPAPVAAL